MVTRLPDDQRTCGICGRLLSDHDSESDVASEVSEGGIVEYVVTGIRGALGDYKAVDDPTDRARTIAAPAATWTTGTATCNGSAAVCRWLASRSKTSPTMRP